MKVTKVTPDPPEPVFHVEMNRKEVEALACLLNRHVAGLAINNDQPLGRLGEMLLGVLGKNWSDHPDVFINRNTNVSGSNGYAYAHAVIDPK